MDKPAKSIIAQLFFNQVKIAPKIHSKERITVDRVMPVKISAIISIAAITTANIATVLFVINFESFIMPLYA